LRERPEKKRRTVRKPGEGAPRERRFLNLKGEASSYALIRCMMQLDELPSGGVLEVLVDDEQVSAELARLLTEEGHRVVEVERTRPGVWKLDIEKGNG